MKSGQGTELDDGDDDSELGRKESDDGADGDGS